MIISFIYWGHTFGVRVQRVQRVQRGKVLKMDGPSAQGFLDLTGPLAPRVADCRSAAMLIKSALRDDLAVSYSINKHSAGWLAALASPYPASPDFHLKVKRLTMICASLALLQIMFAVHPRESVSHDFQVASLPYSTAITDSQYFARHCVPSKYVRWCDSCSLATPIQGAE